MARKRREGGCKAWAGRGLLGLSALLLLFALFTAPRPASAVKTYAASGRSGDYLWPAQPCGSTDVNAADLDELCLLQGVGETIGQLLLDERAANGPFFFPEDLRVVKGIGEKKLAAIMGEICLGN